MFERFAQPSYISEAVANTATLPTFKALVELNSGVDPIVESFELIDLVTEDQEENEAAKTSFCETLAYLLEDYSQINTSLNESKEVDVNAAFALQEKIKALTTEVEESGNDTSKHVKNWAITLALWVFVLPYVKLGGAIIGGMILGVFGAVVGLLAAFVYGIYRIAERHKAASKEIDTRSRKLTDKTEEKLPEFRAAYNKLNTADAGNDPVMSGKLTKIESDLDNLEIVLQR